MPKKKGFFTDRRKPNVFDGDDEYLRHLEKQYQMSRSLERQSTTKTSAVNGVGNKSDDFGNLNRTLSETQLNGNYVPVDRIKKSYQAQLEYELRSDPRDNYDIEEYSIEETKDSTYTSHHPVKPTVPPIRKKV